MFNFFFFQGGDSNSKKVKLDQETEKVYEGINSIGRNDREQRVDALKEPTVGTTNEVSTETKTEKKSGFDELPKELHEMKIRDEKSKNNNEKVFHVIHCFLILIFIAKLFVIQSLFGKCRICVYENNLHLYLIFMKDEKSLNASIIEDIDSFFLLHTGYRSNYSEWQWNRNRPNYYNHYWWSRWTTETGYYFIIVAAPSFNSNILLALFAQ